MKILRYCLFTVAALVSLLVVVVLVFTGKGYMDALSDAKRLGARADELIAQGRGGDSLGTRHRQILLAVQDPDFANHAGVDFFTPGAGLTTITQSASKRLAFDEFSPGIAKLRQTGYALGLEQRLSKAQILALWLDTLEMGNGPDGWMRGFHSASSKIYGRSPAELTRSEFIRLVAVLIAPAAYDLTGEDPALDERARRISHLVAGACAPAGWQDVWLEGCSEAAHAQPGEDETARMAPGADMD